MTVSELLAHLQNLELHGYGSTRVVVYAGYECEPHILCDDPEIAPREYVWDDSASPGSRLIKHSDNYLILGG